MLALVYMNTIRISATAARNRFFELLDRVAQGVEVVIEKDKKEIAVLSPKRKKIDWIHLKKASDDTWGILKDAPHSDLENNPVRRKSSWRRLGTWDKGLIRKKK